MVAFLKKVEVKRSIYTNITDPVKLKEYAYALIAKGMLATLFKDPHILAVFYGSGTDAANAVRDAIAAYKLAPTESNRDAITAKMALLVIWLNLYADKVEIISNDDANRSTREEAKVNIESSYLTAKKLTASKKGNPEKPILVATNVGTGTADVEVKNGKEYAPSKVTFVAVPLPKDDSEAANPIVDLNNGLLNVELFERGKCFTITADGKGRFVTFKGLIPGIIYAIYAYAQNGKKQISTLSAIVIVKG